MPFSSAPSAAPLRTWPKVPLYGDLQMRPIRNAWMLEEIGLPYEHIACRPWSKKAKSVHPLGKVPALVVECEPDGEGEGSEADYDEKFVVLESAAINTFLGDVAREIDMAPTLVPSPATRLRAKYDSLVLFVMTELDAQSLWIHRKHEALPDVFGEAPTAVKEARRQFDGAIDAMVDEIGDEESYLLPSGFSAVDIIFANCCFWAQQIGWLERTPGDAGDAEKQKDGDAETTGPHPLAPKLERYLKRCRARPAFVRANELRKNQKYEKKDTSKL
ncbi:hypothetical protein ACHAXT_012599 [Thalassiosira profunda]